MICLICNEIVTDINNHFRKHGLTIKQYYDKFYKKDSDGVCLFCKKPTNFNGFANGYNKFCCIKCAKQYQSTDKNNINKMLEKKKDTNLKKYGVEYPMQCDIGKQNFVNAIKTKYNVDWYSKSKEFRDKVRETSMKLYGTEHFSQSDICKNKIKNSCISRYGVDNASKLQVFKDKIKETKLLRYNNPNYNNFDKIKKTIYSKYGVEYPMQNVNIKNKIVNKRRKSFIESLFNGSRLNNKVTPLFTKEEYINVDTKYKWKCNICNGEFIDDINCGLIPKCPVCHKNNNISKPETDFLDYLNISNRNVNMNGYNIDGYKNNKIYEFLGDYWHGNPRKYDLLEMNLKNKTTFGQLYNETNDKFKSLYKFGYKIYYIWEMDWNNWLKNKSTPFPIKLYKNHPI